MQKFIFTMLLLGTASWVQAQVTEQPTENLEATYNLAAIDVKPEFPGGISEFYNYIGLNFKAPSDKNFKGGKVFIAFVIEKDGSVTDLKILKDCGFGTGEEALRVLRNCPKWKPAMQNNTPVRCQFSLPINIASR